ncbi:MAG: FlgB family protein [Pseudomonadota bacterium]
MFQNLDIFRQSYAMATHAGQRQAVTARNLANADTPGFRAQDLTPFKDTVDAGAARNTQRATRARHLNGVGHDKAGFAGAAVIIDRAQPSDPNGNSVSVETEILRSVDAKRQHDRALAIYRSSLTILRTSLGRG